MRRSDTRVWSPCSAGALGFVRPAALGWLKGELVTFSLALTMLFMGMTLKVADFERVLKNPKQVFLGFLCQFTIMPLLGLAMATSKACLVALMPLAIRDNNSRRHHQVLDQTRI